MGTEDKKVMVIGGGIAGLTAAWHLAQSGVGVDLVEKTCFLGGKAIGFCCKATDECLQCGACSVEAMLKQVVAEPRITAHLATEVQSIQGAGPFSVALAKSRQPADPGAGPVVRGESLNNRPLHVVLDAAAADPAPEGAVGIDALGTEGPLSVDAVVLASGFAPFDAELKGTYGYNRWPNVISGVDAERLKRQHGTLVRPSDGRRPEKVAFIQCVGSRDERLGNLWCSQVCCSYALRMASGIRHQDEKAEITLFYMDIQNTGRDFAQFDRKCRDQFRFERNIPVDVYPEEDQRLRMRTVDPQGNPVDELFDLLVLSVGIMPAADNPQLSELLGIELNGDGFFAGLGGLDTAATAKAGIFLAGTASGPKTIAASMAQAGQAAGAATKYLGVNQ